MGKNKYSGAKPPARPVDPVAAQKAQLIEQALVVAGDLMLYGKYADAENVYKGILQHAPMNGACFYNMATLCNFLGRTDEAQGWANKALIVDPNDSGAHAILSLIYLGQGKTKEAMETSIKSVQTKPSAKTLTNHANLLMEMGKMSECLEFSAKALKLDPDNIAAYCVIATARKMKKDDPEIAQMLRLEKNSKKLDQTTLAQLKFALAKTFYDLKEYDISFERYAEGNEIKKKLHAFHPEQLEDFIQNIRNIFTPAFVKNLEGKGDPSKRPIFIVGMPRSGTSLVEQILSSHPEVFGAGELKNFYEALGAQSSVVLPDLRSDMQQVDSASTSVLAERCLTPDFMKNTGARYLESLKALDNSKPRLTDKMPFNFIWVGFIRLALPNAKIIHCTRDPVDTGLSIWRQNFTDIIPWACDQKQIAQYYKSYKRMMDFWHALFPGQIYEANYETIVGDQESQTRKLLEFCDLSWDERCLAFHESERQVKTASLAQVRQPIYADSVKAWKKFENHLRPLIDELEKQ